MKGFYKNIGKTLTACWGPEGDSPDDFDGLIWNLSATGQQACFLAYIASLLEEIRDELKVEGE